MRGLIVLTFAAIAVAVSPAHSSAQEDDDAPGRAEFRAGAEAFSQGRYEDALRNWERSHALSNAPELLYNMGTALDRLQRNQEAIDAFRRYLEKRPDADNRVEVEARIRALESAEGDEPEDARADPLAPESSSVVGPAILMITGGAAAIAGGVFLGVALSDKSTVENAPDGARWADYEGERSRVPTLSAVGAILVGVGALAAVGGLVWLLLDGGDSELAVTPGGLSIRGRF